MHWKYIRISGWHVNWRLRDFETSSGTVAVFCLCQCEFPFFTATDWGTVFTKRQLYYGQLHQQGLFLVTDRQEMALLTVIGFHVMKIGNISLTHLLFGSLFVDSFLLFIELLKHSAYAVEFQWFRTICLRFYFDKLLCCWSSDRVGQAFIKLLLKPTNHTWSYLW